MNCLILTIHPQDLKFRGHFLALVSCHRMGVEVDSEIEMEEAEEVMNLQGEEAASCCVSEAPIEEETKSSSEDSHF